MGHIVLAEELKKLIETAKGGRKTQGIVKKLPVNTAQKELNDLLELVQPAVKLKDMVPGGISGITECTKIL